MAAEASARPTTTPTPDLHSLDAWWRAANYLSVGQIYLMDNPLLREPLRPEHVKPRLLGHWGTTPGLTFVWSHLNRVINRDGLEALFVAGPGHGGPAVVATAWLEGTYSERYSNVPGDAEGIGELFRQFSFPGGIPSHAAPETPGSIHEGGELGYSLAHAYGAVFDNPDLLVACVIGDGEAETGALAGSWQANKFCHPVHDGTVLPILHLNGYKIANSTVLARIPTDELLEQLRGHGHRPYVLDGGFPDENGTVEDAMDVHARMADVMDEIVAEIRRIRDRAAEQLAAGEEVTRPSWPVLVLRTPKGWTGPKEVDGKQVEGTFRAHQVPLSEVRRNEGHRGPARGVAAVLPARGALRRCGAAAAGAGCAESARRPSDECESTRQRWSAPARPAAAGLHPARGRRAEPGLRPGQRDRHAGRVAGRGRAGQPGELPDHGPGRDGLQPVAGGVRRDRPPVPGPDRRRGRAHRAVGSGAGGAQRAALRGLAGGVPAHRPARAVQLLRGLHPHRRLDVQPARQVAAGDAGTSRGGGRWHP